jgi:hypothetical protein
MKVIVLWRERSEHRMGVESFLHDLETNYQVEVRSLQIDSREGAAFAELYDITSYPAVVITQDDGQLQRMWGEGRLPLASEVASEAHT